MSILPPWMTITQVAEHCGVERTEVYSKMLPDLEVRRIGVRGGAAPWGRLIRVQRESVLRMRGEPIPSAEMLPRWVTLKQAGDHYQVSPDLIRRMIAYEQLDARHIGSTRAIRIDRESLVQLGRFRVWAAR